MPGLHEYGTPLRLHPPVCPCHIHTRQRLDARRTARKAARIAADTERARKAKGWTTATFPLAA